ncbi:MAG TPA: hypothetical protein VNZ64_09315 [Candidatus Acidoferrum sp.]|jgi:hypothetical protein|nr:hypothetical protein [Candidatus Acidoferrum sp.]
MKTLAIIMTAAALALPGPAGLRAQDSADAAALAQAEDAVKTAQAETQRALDQSRARVEETDQRLKQPTAEGVPLPPHTTPYPGDFSTRLQSIITRASGGGGLGKPLVIQTSNPDPKEQASLEEDLAVMAHILDKALEVVPGTQWRGGGGPRAMGIDVFLGPGSGPARNLYLDGYGALFLVNVYFPLVPPAVNTEEEKPSGDSTWEEAKQELYGGGPGARPPLAPAEEFSQDKVNKLKATLLEALKNASNLRGVKSDESITVCVLGGASATAPRAKRFARAGTGGGGGGGGGGYGGSFTFSSSGAPPQGTIMTIRVKKTDVDAYAKGKVGLEEFQKRARITTYATSADSGNGELSFGGGGGGNISFGGSSGSAGGGGGAVR